MSRSDAPSQTDAPSHSGTVTPHPAQRCCAERMLAAHLPLSLLLDLADPAGPQSGDLLMAEAGDAGWLSRPAARREDRTPPSR